MRSTFSVLDMKKGAFTLLTILRYHFGPQTRGDLEEEAKRMSLGRTALYSAIKALREAGLVQETPLNLDGKRVVTTYFTEKGLAVAEKLIEIREIIDA